MWSIGCIAYVLLCGFPPFYGETMNDLIKEITTGHYNFPDPEWTNISHEGTAILYFTHTKFTPIYVSVAKDFIRKLLVVHALEFKHVQN